MNHHLFYIQPQPWPRLDTSPSWGLVIWLNHHTIVYFCLSTTTTTRYMLFPRTCHLTKLPYDRFLFICQPRLRSLLNTCSSRGLVIWLNLHMIVFCLHDENSLFVCTHTRHIIIYLHRYTSLSFALQHTITRRTTRPYDKTSNLTTPRIFFCLTVNSYAFLGIYTHCHWRQR